MYFWLLLQIYPDWQGHNWLQPLLQCTNVQWIFSFFHWIYLKSTWPLLVHYKCAHAWYMPIRAGRWSKKINNNNNKSQYCLRGKLSQILWSCPLGHWLFCCLPWLLPGIVSVSVLPLIYLRCLWPLPVWPWSRLLKWICKWIQTLLILHYNICFSSSIRF